MGIGTFKSILSRITFKRVRYIINGVAGLVLHKIFKNRRTRVWVWGSGSGYYENNVKVFLEYCIDKDSNVMHYFETHRENLNLPVKRLKKGSLKAYIMAFNAETLLFDSGYSDIAPGFVKYANGLKVNLNHGQEGFKKLPIDYYKKINADIHCAVSDFEKDIKIRECGAPESTVYVTGQARYDNISCELKPTLNILLFFTWRDGLQEQTESEVRSGAYFKKIEEVLFSPKVAQLLEDAGAYLYFRIHPMIIPFEIAVPSERIVSIGPNYDFSKLINDCQILITDYSSMAWDFMYNGRIVVFYPFDYEEYSQDPGLYLDMQNDLESDVASDCRSLEESLRRAILEITSRQTVKVVDKVYFKFHDNNNCERIYSLILEKIKS